jgi:hypothetical protein
MVTGTPSSCRRAGLAASAPRRAGLRQQRVGVEGPQGMQHRLAALHVSDQLARHVQRRHLAPAVQRQQLDGAAQVQAHPAGPRLRWV